VWCKRHAKTGRGELDRKNRKRVDKWGRRNHFQGSRGSLLHIIKKKGIWTGERVGGTTSDIKKKMMMIMEEGLKKHLTKGGKEIKRGEGVERAEDKTVPERVGASSVHSKESSEGGIKEKKKSRCFSVPEEAEASIRFWGGECGLERRPGGVIKRGRLQNIFRKRKQR